MGGPGAATPGTIRIRLDLAYDGSEFAGWARQPTQRTVQGVLEQALLRVLRVDAVHVTVAGRTDAGVHAQAQVAHLDLPEAVWLACGAGLLRRLAAVLPPDLVVHGVASAPPAFDARFAAEARCYRYRIADRLALRDPLRRNHVWWTRRDLEVSAMHEAMEPLLGLHDFAAFCRARPAAAGATTIRNLQEFTWQRPAVGPDADLAVATVVADAFCHNMVRALVGAAVAVGEGRRAVSWPTQVLALRDRGAAAAVAPAHGLTLEAVRYPPDAELAARVERVRARRTLDDAGGTT